MTRGPHVPRVPTVIVVSGSSNEDLKRRLADRGEHFGAFPGPVHVSGDEYRWHATARVQLFRDVERRRAVGLVVQETPERDFSDAATGRPEEIQPIGFHTAGGGIGDDIRTKTVAGQIHWRPTRQVGPQEIHKSARDRGEAHS